MLRKVAFRQIVSGQDTAIFQQTFLDTVFQLSLIAELDRTAPELDTAASRGDAIPAEAAPSCRLTAKMHVSSI